MTTQPTGYITRCSKCGHEWEPYEPGIIPPIMDKLTCPECGHAKTAIWDRELLRELARKKLGLEKYPVNKIIELENKVDKLEGKLDGELKTLREIFTNIQKWMKRYQPILDEAEKDYKDKVGRATKL